MIYASALRKTSKIWVGINTLGTKEEMKSRFLKEDHAFIDSIYSSPSATPRATLEIITPLIPEFLGHGGSR